MNVTGMPAFSATARSCGIPASDTSSYGARSCAVTTARSVSSRRSRGTTDKPGLALGSRSRRFVQRLRLSRYRRRRCGSKVAALAAGDAERRLRTELLPVRLKAGDRVPALAFVARREHRQYVGDLKPEHAAALVVQGVGASGTALDNFRKVVVHLDDFGIADCPLDRVLELAETMSALS